MKTNAMFLVLALILLGVPAAAQEEVKEEAGKEVEDSSSTKLEQGDEAFGAREYESAREHYESAATLAEQEGNNSNYTEACAQVARMHSIAGEFEKGRPWLKRAKEAASEDEPKGWSRYLGVRGRFEWQDQKDNEKARRTFIEMYEYCRKHELFRRELDAAHMVAIVAPKDEQIAWSLKAIDAAEKADDQGWLAVLWNNLGWTYDENDMVEKSLVALINAQKYHYADGSAHSRLVADFGVAHALRRNGKLVAAREMLADARERAGERHRDEPENAERGEWVGWGHKYEGDLLMDEGKPGEALEHYRKARPYLVEAGIENWWPEGLKELDDRIAELEDADEGEAE